MPKQKDLKRLVRTRMQKTGESYTAARAQIVRRPQAAATPAASVDLAARAGMSDAAVVAKTGAGWRTWVSRLDAVDAAAMSHRAIAAHLREDHGLSAWWSQSVAVGYERIRGLRARGQRRSGTWDVNKSKTLPVPVATLYDAFTARRRARWLPDAGLRISSSRRPEVMHFRWQDGTRVDVHFWKKGASKSQVQLQHRGLPTKARADALRELWTERLRALQRILAE